MNLRDPYKWWRLTRVLAWTATAAATLATMAALAGVPLLASFELLGVPAGLFVAVLFVPLVLTGFVLVLDRQQKRVDRSCNLNDVE